MRTSAVAAAFLSAACCLTMRAVDAPVANRAPLTATTFLRLPLGSVQARGWLHEQLRLQAAGLTGRAEEVLPDLGPDNAWRGGDGDDREKAPYYLRGLVALAWTLGDTALKAKAGRWIDVLLDRQGDDGRLGPAGNEDWWPRMVATAVLRDWAEATGDARVVPALLRQARLQAQRLPTAPLTGTARARAADQIDTLFWLYNRTGHGDLLDCAALLRRQSHDWTSIFADNRFLCSGVDFHPRHGVDIAHGGRLPLVWSQIAQPALQRAAFLTGWDHLLRDHGLAFGMYSASEHLAGRSAMQGVELCAIVEAMLTHEHGLAITGEAVLGDRLETLAFNALPAALGKDLKTYQYYTVANLPTAQRGHHGYAVDYDDGLLPGPHSGCHCCCYNLHMGWPKYIQHAWMATADGGLAAVAHGPTTVTADIGGQPLTITSDTAYPFTDTIRFTIDTPAAAAFPLVLRVPAWCRDPAITVNGVAEDGVRSASFHRLARTWRRGDTVLLTLPMAPTPVHNPAGGTTVWRGPLAFALRIGERHTPTGPAADGCEERTVEPTTPWNYALDLGADGAAALTVAIAAMPAQPWATATTPVTIAAPARRVPSWTMAWNGRLAFDPPPVPVATTAPVETITLVPFGATTLRMTSMPLVGVPPPPHDLQADFTTGGLAAWTAYGDAWRIQDGRLRATVGGSGAKALVRGACFGDLVLEADVHLGKGGGDCGLLFRVGNAAIGCDAFDGYYVGLTPGGHVILGKGHAERWFPIAHGRFALDADGPQHLRIEAVGPLITVRVNRATTAQITARDGQYAAGCVGVRIFNTAIETTAFANLVARPWRAGDGGAAADGVASSMTVGTSAMQAAP